MTPLYAKAHSRCIHACVCVLNTIGIWGAQSKVWIRKKIIIKFLKNQDCEGHNVFAVTLEFAEFGNLAWRDQRILPRQIAEILKFETKQCRLCREREVQYKNSSFFSFQTFRVGPYGALEHKITFPKAIIDTWKRKFFLSTVCNLIHFYQKLMIWSSAMFTNPTFHFFRSAHWSHLGWKNAKKVNKKSRRNSFEKCLEVSGAKRRAMITYIQLSFFISCTFSNQFGAVCKSNSIAVVVIVVAQNHLFSRDEWRHIQLTGDW